MTFAILDAKQPSDAGHSTSKSWHCKAKIVGKSMRLVRGSPPVLFQSILGGSTDPDLQMGRYPRREDRRHRCRLARCSNAPESPPFHQNVMEDPHAAFHQNACMGMIIVPANAAENVEKTQPKDVSDDVLSTVNWDDSKMATHFANVVNIQSTLEQVDPFFGTNQTWNVPSNRRVQVELNNRIILSPHAAKRLWLALGGVLEG
jgi:hypothetical protein